MIENKLTLLLLLALLLSFALVPATIESAQPAQGPDPSSYRLVGTITANGLTGAVLVDSKGEQTFYRLHDRLLDGSEVAGVRDDSILIMRSDSSTLYEIFIAHDTKTGVPQAGPLPNAGSVTPEAAAEGAVRKEQQPRKHGRTRHPSQKEE